MRKFNVVLGAFVLATLYTVTVVQAQLTEVMWGGNTGSQSWQDNANWAGGAFPNDQLKIADLSVDLGANLTLNVGATDVTIAQMSVGSLSNPITTDIISSGGRLVFRNDDADVTTVGSDADFNNDTSVNGRDFLVWQRGFGKSGENINDSGDANADNVVDGADLAIWQAQYGLGAGLFNPGSPGIESIGVAGVTNVLNAPIHLVNQQLEIGGTRDFVINGNITYEVFAL